MTFTFGDIVVVEDIQIGVIVKCWANKTYEVYVRSYNSIREYEEGDIQRYMVRHKYLSEEERFYQNNIINS